MTAKPKTPSAARTSSLLAEAGFSKSVSSGTRIRGYRSHSRGFVVKRGDAAGVVHVYHEHGNFVGTDATRREQVERQERYAQVIEAAGYAVERGDGGLYGPLVVTARTEES